MSTNALRAVNEAKRLHSIALEGLLLHECGTPVSINEILRRVPHVPKSVTLEHRPGWASALRWHNGCVTNIWLDRGLDTAYQRYAYASIIGHALMHTTPQGRGERHIVWSLDRTLTDSQAAEAAWFAKHLLAPLTSVEPLLEQGLGLTAIAQTLVVPVEVVDSQYALIHSLGQLTASRP